MIRQRRTVTFLILFVSIGILLMGSWTTLRATAAPPISGGIFSVTRLDDPIPDTCDANDCSLREAIIAANALSIDSTTINFNVTGTVELSLSGADEDNAATGDLDINAPVLLDGLSLVTVDANGLDRVFDVALENSESVTVIKNGADC